MKQGMEALVSLEYPNGRIHETSLTTSGVLQPGHEFDLYGRRWRAVGLNWPLPGRGNTSPRMLCISTGQPSTPARLV